MGHHNFDRFSELIDYVPAIYEGNLLNLLYLDDSHRINDSRSYQKNLSGCVLMDERREYIFSSDLEGCTYFPFPYFSTDERPEPTELTEALFQKFNFAIENIFSQDKIAEHIINLATKNKPDVIALILVDGLSYYDFPEVEGEQPCIVPGLTTTDFGFRTIIGKPSVSNRLFFHGYKHQKAFSYFDYSNTLSASIHDGFPEVDYIRIKETKDVFNVLKTLRPKHDYFQIVLEGLDILCHSHFDAPPKELYLSRILDCLEKIEAIFMKKKLHYQIHLVSDHGILWNDTYDNFIITDDLFPEDSHHPRYVKGAFNRTYGRISNKLGSAVTLFKAPYIARAFRNNEWGMHGGISAWESIVPFITRTG